MTGHVNGYVAFREEAADWAAFWSPSKSWNKSQIQAGRREGQKQNREWILKLFFSWYYRERVKFEYQEFGVVDIFEDISIGGGPGQNPRRFEL